MSSPLSRAPALALLASLALSFASVASAQPAPTPATPPETADEQARRVFTEGRAHFAQSRYAEALASFRDAYELSGRPELLFNIGQAADRLRHDREALTAFEGYLAALPEAENRIEVETRIRVIRDDLSREDALREQARASAQPAPSENVLEAWWLWTIVGVVVVGAGIGIGFAVGSHEEIASPTPGDVGMGGVIFAIEGP